MYFRHFRKWKICRFWKTEWSHLQAFCLPKCPTLCFFSHDIYSLGTPRYPLDIMGKTLLFYKIIDFYTMCITFSHRASPDQAHPSSALHGPGPSSNNAHGISLYPTHKAPLHTFRAFRAENCCCWTRGFWTVACNVAPFFLPLCASLFSITDSEFWL